MSGFVYSEKPIEIVEGDGPYLYDDQGTEYLDMGASYACVPLGHGHDVVTDTIETQLSRLTYVQGSYPVAVRTQLYETLGQVAPGDIEKVWLCNSGTEANEAALKFARAATGDTKIVATTQGFHGRTMGALSATWKDKYKTPYGPLLDDVEFVPYGDEEAIVEAVDDQTAAVIVEPIQGEGGINPASTDFMRTIRDVTTEANAALILDEVQTGLGRTGTLWACERTSVVPDILTSAKGLGNGLPIGATLCRDWIAEEYGDHASTFSGNPLISAAAQATISTIIDDELPAHAAEVGAYLQKQLETEVGNRVRDIRGEGLMLGVVVKRGANRILQELAINYGVLALPAGRTVVRLLPPLTIDKNHADHVVDALGEIID
ncbi:aspartate aminotransferase family protein [Halosimplex pelagicum]|uniref:Putative [LysW]-aminoadipate semialdehyde/glutamate semialdehyde transaminase n=1 Tax=Halosimplex pelagicum TaxID=869886 RepID=A0A7D5TGU3_9EURY|nr:aspartate aminotransferase family protein [Halosimplex pelagicum]QLH82076.1 aspartate aminotransferase family protein [Halosimplex pelagicum]